MNLSENYRLVFDENNVTLQFFEQRERNKQDGTKEPFEYTDNLYYPNVKTALKAFLQKSLNGSESVEQCLKRINEVEVKIDKITKKL